MAPVPPREAKRAAVAPAANHVLLRLLDLAEQTWVGAAEIGRIPEEAGLKLRTLEAEIYFLRELADVVRALPLRVYKEPDQRERLIDAVQEALDDAVRREEEALDAQGEGG
jgi:type III secretion protein W